MKIALIGDLQYASGEDLRPAMTQVAQWQPDWAFSMGDMGCPGEIGTRTGMLACRELLDGAGCPVAALMGNHDVEYRPDDDTQYRQPHPWFAGVFGDAHHALEAEGWLILGVSVERQPMEGLMTQHALYVSDEQYAWVCRQLESHRGWPTIVISHAPAAGSGLRCVPSIHYRATDAYLDHGFQPLRWRKLTQDWRQIRLWCSAHFHMGHDSDASISLADDVLHVSCGVMTSAARDGCRHTRLLTVEHDRVIISTLNHATGAVVKDAAVSADGQVSGRFAIRKHNAFPLGNDRPCKLWTAPKLDRAWAATESGRLWEIDLKLQELSGTISREPACALAVREGRLYVQGESCFSAALEDPARFDRLSGCVPPAHRVENTLPCPTLQEIAFEASHRPDGWYLLIP